jgi:hypothetical protein
MGVGFQAGTVKLLSAPSAVSFPKLCAITEFSALRAADPPSELRRSPRRVSVVIPRELRKRHYLSGSPEASGASSTPGTSTIR